MTPPTSPPSRDPERLLRELDATIRIKDIKEWHRLREVVSIKWWESVLLALLFVSGVAILVTIAKLVPDTPRPLYYFILVWSVLWVLTLIACIEFLILKFRALRRMHEITDRTLHRLEEEMGYIREALEAKGIPVGPNPSAQTDSDETAPHPDTTGDTER